MSAVDRATESLAEIMGGWPDWAAARAFRSIDVDDVAGVLIDHTRVDGVHGDCSCGHVVPLGHSFAAHQAEAVKAHLMGATAGPGTVASSSQAGVQAWTPHATRRAVAESDSGS